MYGISPGIVKRKRRTAAYLYDNGITPNEWEALKGFKLDDSQKDVK